MPILSNLKSRFLGSKGIPAWASTATWQVVTTGAATHTIAALTVSDATVVDWGDGSSDTYNGAGERTHNYAGAGTWTVSVMQPSNVTTLVLNDAKTVLDSSGIASMSNIVDFAANFARAGVFNSVDIAAWRPQTFQLGYQSTGYVGTFNSRDIATWNPVMFYLRNMPVGFIGTFNTADIAAWNATTVFSLHTVPTGYTIVAGGGLSSCGVLVICNISNNALQQAAVNAILYELYQASIAPRTGVNGTIDVGGSNAAPSGTFQAVASPPVSAATPGKEIAYELLNDTIGAFANHWATVTTS